MTSLGTISTDTNSPTLDGIFSKLREIDFNFIENWIVSVETSTIVYDSRFPKYLIDAEQYTYYYSRQASDKIITIDFHENSFHLRKYVMQRYSSTDFNPLSWTISGFQGESLIPICSNDSFPVSSSFENKLFPCQSISAFNKFELRLAQKGTNQNDFVAFCELEFFGILNPNMETIPNSNTRTSRTNIYCISSFGLNTIFHLYQFAILGILS